MFNFAKLETWQKAIDFADLVCSTTRALPDDERFGLTSQMRRAAVSVTSNIAAGASRFSHDNYARFLEIASGSLVEVVSQSFVARRQGVFGETDFTRLCSAAKEKSRMLSGLRRSLRAK